MSSVLWSRNPKYPLLRVEVLEIFGRINLPLQTYEFVFFYSRQCNCNIIIVNTIFGGEGGEIGLRQGFRRSRYMWIQRPVIPSFRRAAVGVSTCTAVVLLKRLRNDLGSQNKKKIFRSCDEREKIAAIHTIASTCRPIPRNADRLSNGLIGPFARRTRAPVYWGGRTGDFRLLRRRFFTTPRVPFPASVTKIAQWSMEFGRSVVVRDVVDAPELSEMSEMIAWTNAWTAEVYVCVKDGVFFFW